MSKIDPLFLSILAPMCPKNAAPQDSGRAAEDRTSRHGDHPAVAGPIYEPPPRTSSVIVASIRTASLTLHEQGEILGEIASRICMCIREYPELEETCHDLSQTYEAYKEAEDKINDRLYRKYGPSFCEDEE